MFWFSGFIGAFRCKKQGDYTFFQNNGDDCDFIQRMRDIAVRFQVFGRKRLAISNLEILKMRKIFQKARQIDRTIEDSGETLKRFLQERRLIEHCVQQAAAEGGTHLPADREGKLRIDVIADALILGGEMRLTKERLLKALKAYNEVQPLTMKEMWAIPEALRISLSRSFVMQGQEIVKTARQKAEAEKWLESGKKRVISLEPAFIEHTMRMAAEREISEIHEVIANVLSENGESVELVIKTAHEKQAKLRMRLENLLESRRILETLKWQSCFETLSPVERELRCDPSGVYGNMDDESRTAVREETAKLAEKLKLEETTIARYAVSAARQAMNDEVLNHDNVCYWLTEDEGRSALLRYMGVEKRLSRKIPDSDGKKCTLLIIGLSAVLMGLWALWINNCWLWIPGVPIAWMMGNTIIGRFYPLAFSPVKLLKMEVKRVPEEWRTLVVMPVLLSNVQRAEKICAHMEALGCMEKDENIRYLLLGDFADGNQEYQPKDESIVETVRNRIQEMNARAGEEKYYYLHRPRRWTTADRRWMGFDRKRGALMALNRVLIGKPGAEEAFSVEGNACTALIRRFAFVITLDEDTHFLPGTAQRLIGAIAHPLNRANTSGKGYGVIQPQMEMTPEACTNQFVFLFAGAGGVNTYPISISNFWQDLTGRGIFAGKGIYDVNAFQNAMEGALPEGRILSHDLIEGIIVGAGFADDISFYDGYPATLSGCLKRLNRWTRGDWQLLPFLFSRKVFPNGRQLKAADRLKLFDNLMRSLVAPALMMAFLGAIWTGSGEVLLAALLAAYFLPILSLFGKDPMKWRRATAELAILPARAWCMIDAVIRTLWRLGVSGKHLMDWVTAADAETAEEKMRLPGRVAAILLLPGFFVPKWIPATIALITLFTVGYGWVCDMEQESLNEADNLSPKEIGALTALAKKTWRFFETYVPFDGCGLPPDNVQIDPPTGLAKRTSPTNIGLYLVSCLAAFHMGFIRREEMLQRMEKTIATLEDMEKWRGHLYNWYDIDDLRPLSPKYVSSVDSGNLAACLLMCAAGIDEEHLAARMAILAQKMDFEYLFDSDRELFVIGVETENHHVSASHYDLLASESRILSYVAIMLGQIPIRHWQRLSRPCISVEKRMALMSWSGTMFEYLMPEIFMTAPEKSLLGQSNRAVVRAQQTFGRIRKRPWGVSESGYYAFDGQLNYQYRAFGLRTLAMNNSTVDEVIAPYAGVLAAKINPSAAAKNIAHMEEMGWLGKYGFYESADYLRSDGNGRPALVKSHMAHHQGMILAALCNALTNGALISDFMKNPEARALRLLLQEKPTIQTRIKNTDRNDSFQKSKSEIRTVRIGGLNRRLADTHLIYGGEGTALITGDGALRYMQKGICATRFDGDLLNRRDGAYLHYRNMHNGEEGVFGGDNCKVTFDAGAVEFDLKLQNLTLKMKICISPEDGTLIKAITLRNSGEQAEEIALTDIVPIALCEEADMRAHPIFRNLFVESYRAAQCAISFKRRPREKDEYSPVLSHMVFTPGKVDCETDYGKLMGRMGDTGHSDGVSKILSNSTGAILNPVSALQTRIVVTPGASVKVHFALNLLETEEASKKWIAHYDSWGADERPMQLAMARAQTTLNFIGLKPNHHHLLQRASALLFDGKLAAAAKTDYLSQEDMPRERLWEMGVSGDIPILMMKVSSIEGENTREIICAHEFYRSMGIWTDLVFIDDFSGGYDQPVRDMLTAQIAASHLSTMQAIKGGVWIMDGGKLTGEQRQALMRGAAMIFDGKDDFYKQLRRILCILERKDNQPIERMNIGECRLGEEKRTFENGYGGFLSDDSYCIDIAPDRTTPAPWVNILANDRGGILLTERAGGFIWHENSRNGRLTAFKNDALNEGWGMMFYLYHPQKRECLRLLPGDRPDMPFRVRYNGAIAEYRFENQCISGKVSFCMGIDAPETRIRVEINDEELQPGEYCLIAFVDWLMGTDAQDAAWLKTWNDGRACYASGVAKGVGYFAAQNERTRTGANRIDFLGRGNVMRPEGIDEPGDSSGYTLKIPVVISAGSRQTFEFVLGWAETPLEAQRCTRGFYDDRKDAFNDAERLWKEKMDCLRIDTPDSAVNYMSNGFLIHQTISSRICGRTGFYQPGGAYGFRDQLQDMLAVLHFEPERVREHLLRCAAHQFEAGDVMHWWHEPDLGVRTNISDDCLFLPWVTAAYVKYSGDESVLFEQTPYLEDAIIPEGREDVFQKMHPGAKMGTLHEHCMRAFRKASAVGVHGLALMGTGDWNDGMNRVGAAGRGESVWLSEFIRACARVYEEIAPHETDKVWLRRLAENMKIAIEAQGWDGEWYLRAYTDSGAVLGGKSCENCRIDVISQAWAAIAELEEARCESALNKAWEMLADQQLNIIRLLTPAFDGRGIDPGYIGGYPPGVRENGAQYTHAACWLLWAFIHRGDAERAHRALEMLLPPNHSDTPEKAERYCVEPYVMAADVYSAPPNEGHGGWTWYTGAAAWMYNCILALLGYERQKNRVRLNALLGKWRTAQVEVKFGESQYRLICNSETEYITFDGKRVDGEFIEMVDDGEIHTAYFPPRTPA